MSLSLAWKRKALGGDKADRSRRTEIFLCASFLLSANAGNLLAPKNGGNRSHPTSRDKNYFFPPPANASITRFVLKKYKTHAG
jgi:hypothetical protein